MQRHSWGAIFDWDGVIIDSAAQHEESWERLAREEGRPLPPDHFKRGFGMKNERIIPDLLGWKVDAADIRRLSLRKEALYREIICERGVSPLPGVAQWLRQLREAQIPCVIGSSTHRANIEVTLDLIGLASCFSSMVTSEDVKHGKPNPEVFLLAAKQIACPPERCVVFEDALVGIQAARAGCMKVVGVATTHSNTDLTGADVVVRRLDELDFQRINGWFSKADGKRQAMAVRS
ncbi:MAG: HAD family phosphatase [Verrucomicrobia bacterium]|nr:HAD family phosphatase [Verrucomicrobiota bacterium]